MKKVLYILLIALFAGRAYADIPDPPSPPRLVNDFAGVLASDQANSLEAELEAYSRSTSTQIVVVTVPSLDGYDIADYSFKLGEKWGVGQKGKNNGVVIVFKPKTDRESGQVFVAVGYGLEGIIPDAVANRLIVDNEMIPHFKENDIYGGLSQGCKVIMSLASKEFTAQEYEEKTATNGGWAFGIIMFIFIMVIAGIAGRSRNQNFTMSNPKGGLPFWVLMSMLNNSGNRNNKDWDDFTHGSGGFGGGGGFGGFGGGSFGGGGAGGSW